MHSPRHSFALADLFLFVSTIPVCVGAIAAIEFIAGNQSYVWFGIDWYSDVRHFLINDVGGKIKSIVDRSQGLHCCRSNRLVRVWVVVNRIESSSWNRDSTMASAVALRNIHAALFSQMPWGLVLTSTKKRDLELLFLRGTRYIPEPGVNGTVVL